MLTVSFIALMFQLVISAMTSGVFPSFLMIINFVMGGAKRWKGGTIWTKRVTLYLYSLFALDLIMKQNAFQMV